MSSVLAALQNQIPLIWITTNEPERLIGKLPAWSPTRNIFQFDARNGLMEWDRAAKQWTIVLVEAVIDEEGTLADIPIMNPDKAMGYVLDQPLALYLMRNAHIGIEDYFNYFSAVFGEYRQAVWQDKAAKLPIQFVCLSHKSEVPEEISAMTTRCEFGLPSVAEIHSIINLVAESQGEKVLVNQRIERIVEASKGLTELEIFDLYLESLRDHDGVLNDEFINDEKLRRWKTNSILEIIKPRYTFDSVGGLDRAKELIQRADWINSNPELAANYKVSPMRRFLFAGPPGTGKSLLCEAASSMLGLDLARVSIAQAMNRFVGQSEENMRAMFAAARAVAPISLWIDEIGRDLSGGGSSDVVDGGTTSRVHATFLTNLQELPDNIFLYAAANSLSALAPEMLRAGRFDKILFIGFPAYSERIEIFKIFLGDEEVEHDYERLAEATASFTGAEIEVLVQYTRNEICPVANRPVNTDDIISMIAHQKNRVWLRFRPEMIALYRLGIAEHVWGSSAQLEEARHYADGNVPTVSSSRPKPKMSTLIK